MNTRVTWVDYAKAIGIILVVYGHVARGLQKCGIELPARFYELADSVVYTFHMPLFFFLSGLFFYESFLRFGGKQLVFKKIDTILYPYLVWSLLQGGIEVALSGHTNGATSMNDVLSLFWAPRAQFWFLYALFAIFLVSAVIYTVLPRKAIALVLPAFIVLYLLAPVWGDHWAIRALFGNLVFFVFGIAFAAQPSIDYLESGVGLGGTLCAFLLAQWIFHGPLALKYSDRGVYSLAVACISILFVISVSTHLARRPIKLLAYIGASSMVIYLLHILAGSGARIVTSRLFGVESPTVHLMVGCLAGVFLPLLALKIIERYKVPYLFSAPVSVWLASVQKKFRHGHSTP